MVRASYIRYPLNFIRPAGTSRGTLYRKESWFLRLVNGEGIEGFGEVSFIPGLSREGPDRVERELERLCGEINRGTADPAREEPDVPGIRFALESALQDLEQGGSRILFPSAFTEGRMGIPINGLIWMGDRRSMVRQIREKVEQGFRVLKMKVGALDREEELEVVRWVRSEFNEPELEIRLDANGAWSPEEAPEMMAAFAGFGIHSVEQPIASGQREAMAELCIDPAIPVALDEELLGVRAFEEKELLLKTIRPDFIIVKPGLLGGFSVAKQWIDLAGGSGIGWWITSALESAIGLNAIAQWTGWLGVVIPQGLGTGNIYSNNIPSPLSLENEKLWYRAEKGWEPVPLTER